MGADMKCYDLLLADSEVLHYAYPADTFANDVTIHKPSSANPCKGVSSDTNIRYGELQQTTIPHNPASRRDPRSVWR
jgi:hypothetical protein